MGPLVHTKLLQEEGCFCNCYYGPGPMVMRKCKFTVTGHSKYDKQNIYVINK